MRVTGLMKYYASRVAVTAVAMGLLVVAGSPWWIVTAIGVLALGFFLLAPRSGRYVVRVEKGATALRRDERTQAVAHKAARNGFIVLMLATAAVAVYWGTIERTSVPTYVLYILVAIGWVIYFASDSWLRRR